MDIIKSQTGSGLSKRVLAAVSSGVALVMLLLTTLGHGQAAQEVQTQAPAISDNLTRIIEAVLCLVSSGAAIWSRWQDKRPVSP